MALPRGREAALATSELTLCVVVVRVSAVKGRLLSSVDRGQLAGASRGSNFPAVYLALNYMRKLSDGTMELSSVRELKSLIRSRQLTPSK